jgi:uncharacterized protein YceH (UPF0502 family)
MSPDPDAVDTQTDSTGTAVATPPDQEAPVTPQTWPVLSPIERRILGVLVEKQKTSKTADIYPLTLNALVTGCNQKSNREPVLELDSVQVDEGLTALQNKGLIERVTGGRAERFRHKLYEAWTRNGPELAVLAELLLRGPQTRGELRVRASRMDAIDTLEALGDILKTLAARGLVVYLGDPERRGAQVAHGFHTEEELAQLRAGLPPVVERARAAAPAPDVTGWEGKLAAALAEIESLRERTGVLEQEVAHLKQQLAGPAAEG